MKCQCAGLVGSKGGCYNNADAEKLSRKGVNPGDCICKPGFTGSRCDKCEKGYHNFPYCEPCPCALAGTMNEVRIFNFFLDTVKRVLPLKTLGSKGLFILAGKGGYGKNTEVLKCEKGYEKGRRPGSGKCSAGHENGSIAI